MKKFKPLLFLSCTLVLATITFFSFSEAYTHDEGILAHRKYNSLLVDFFNVMRFPSHVLFPRYTATPFYFSVGLIVNCLFYGFIIERLVYYIDKLIFEEEETSE